MQESYSRLAGQCRACSHTNRDTPGTWSQDRYGKAVWNAMLSGGTASAHGDILGSRLTLLQPKFTGALTRLSVAGCRLLLLLFL